MKKRFLELLIKSMGLTPKDITSFRTDGCGGQYQIVVGWMGQGLDKDGDCVIDFDQPGFNEAVCEILDFIKRNPEFVDIRPIHDFKV